MQLATLCYVQRNDETLMLLRNKKKNDIHEGKWNGLGGKIEPGESPEMCVIREVREESGLRIQSPELAGIITFPAFDGEQDWYVFVYTASQFTGTLIDSPEGELQWIAQRHIFALNMWEGDHRFLQWLFAKRFFSARLSYHQKKLVHTEVCFYPVGPS